MSETIPTPIEVKVCSVCGEAWFHHIDYDEDDSELPVTLLDCIRILKRRNEGPPGPPGPMGPAGTLPVDPARSVNPPEALAEFLRWLQQAHLLSEAADLPAILRRYWSAP